MIKNPYDPDYPEPGMGGTDGDPEPRKEGGKKMGKASTMEQLAKEHPELAAQAEVREYKVPPRNGKKIPAELQEKLLRFAQQHGMMINPFGLGYYAESYVQLGHCACDPGRPVCPCPEAPMEVHEKGYCKCHLYWRSMDTFLEIKGWNKEA